MRVGIMVIGELLVVELNWVQFTISVKILP